MVGLPVFGSRYFAIPHNRCEELCRAELGAVGYARAFARGSALGLDAAVARALASREATRAGTGSAPAGNAKPARPRPEPGAGGYDAPGADERQRA
jgi:hypothetical protein